MELPEYLYGGELARLIPVGSGGQRERAACSVLLASLQVVQPFARSFFRHMGQRVGSWSRIYAYTEPVLCDQPDEDACRPDGLLILDTGRKQWMALVEAKIGNAKIKGQQLERYTQLARQNGIDAVITVSNQLTPRPTHLPYRPPAKLRDVELYHWSWPHLTMLAELLLRQEEVLDEEQSYILEEVVRFLDHDSTGIVTNGQMGEEWRRLVEKVQASATVTTTDDDLLGAISSWHEQLTNLRIRLTRDLHLPVTVRLRKGHRHDRNARSEHDARTFLNQQKLSACLSFQGAAAPVEVVADTLRRSLVCKLTLEAPRNRQRPSSRIRWLLRQLPQETDPNTRVDIIWERGHRRSMTLTELTDDVDRIKNGDLNIKAFEVVLVNDLGSRFSGSKTFVHALETTVTSFYSVVSSVRPWQAATTAAEADNGADADLETEVADAALEPDGEEAAVDSLSIVLPDQTPKKVGTIMGRSYALFEDGSIEIETSKGLRRYRDFLQLQEELAAQRTAAAAE